MANLRLNATSAWVWPGICRVSLKSRSGRLKLYQKLCRRRDIDERLFRRKPDSNLIYERTAVFERRLSLGFLEHDCASIQPCLAVTRRLKATGIFWARTWHVRIE